MKTALEQQEAVQQWKQSLHESALSRGKSFSEKAWEIRLYRIEEYTDFTGLTPDELIEEDVDAAMKRLTSYFYWLTGEEMEGKEERDRSISWNSAVSYQAYVRGFYTHNDVLFPKRFKTPKRRVSKVTKRDSRTPVYEYDEDLEETVMNGVLRHFIANLGFRDQAIALCLLSTGADTADLVSLNMGFVRDARGELKRSTRFFWHGERQKNKEEFKTYFSKEASQFLKRYVEQERMGAGDGDPLFVYRMNGNTERLSIHAVQEAFRKASEEMGYTEKGKAHPFRPKRFRHLFRTACGTAHIDPGYTMAMMGHNSGISASYLERGQALFLKEYIRVEPYLTVFGADQNEFAELTEDVEGLKNTISRLEGELEKSDKRFKRVYDRNEELTHRIDKLEDAVNEATGNLSDECIDHTFDRLLKEKVGMDFEELKQNLDNIYPVVKERVNTFDTLIETIKERNPKLLKGTKLEDH